jgi:hypothetical protein
MKTTRRRAPAKVAPVSAKPAGCGATLDTDLGEFHCGLEREHEVHQAPLLANATPTPLNLRSGFVRLDGPIIEWKTDDD